MSGLWRQLGCTVRPGHATEAPNPGFFARLKGRAVQVTSQTPTEIDGATAPAFLAEMCEAIDWADNRAVVIECSAITFMDSSAIHALFDAREYAIAHDHVLVVRGLPENCLRVVRICDPGHELVDHGEFHPTCRDLEP